MFQRASHSGLHQKVYWTLKQWRQQGKGMGIPPPPPPPVYLVSPCLSARKWGRLCFIFSILLSTFAPKIEVFPPAYPPPPPPPIKNHGAATARTISIWCGVIIMWKWKTGVFGREQYSCTVQESLDPTLILPYMQPLKNNNWSARAAAGEQRENIYYMCCFVRQTLSTLAS